MGKKYIATVMDRHYVGDFSFIFSCNHAVIGEIDEESGFFIDRNGNEYAPMLSMELMTSEIPYAYSNVLELDEVKKKIGLNLSLADSISEYESLCRKLLFYVGATDDGEPFCLSLNMDDLNNTVKDVQSLNTKVGEYEDLSDFSSHIIDLISDIIAGKYSLEELKVLQEEIKSDYDDIEQILDTVRLQIEATEKGESFVKLPEDKENKEEILKEENNWIDIDDLFNKVTKTLIAQDEPARRVITEIARKEMDSRKKKEGILLTGSTGVGKTELMRLIAKYLNRPFYKIDSTQLTIPGYVGKDIEEVLWDLYVNCGMDLEETENAIIFFDEIDKKGSGKKSDVSGQGVLNLLLAFIEGTTYDACQDTKTSTNRVKINTSNMTVILGGAYTDVYKNLIQKNELGFGNLVSTTPVYRNATTQDFINQGMMTDEFMGRVTVVHLNDLDIAALKRVMLESDESALKIQEEIFDKLGVKITFTDSYTTAIAKDAYNKKTGARGLNGVIDETTWKAFRDVYSNRGKYEEVILDEETVKNSDCYQLVKKKEKIN